MTEQTTLPTYRLPGFITFLTVVFINAFVDLGHKIIIQNTVFKIYNGSEQIILTAVVNSLIPLAFILVFTLSGSLADHFSKPKIMQWSALAAVVITLLITLAYYQGWFIFAFSMTFILALQSALYSPAKYGYIREIAGNNGLAHGNGLVQATTITAILLGVFLFSIAFEYCLQNQTYHSEQEIIRLITPIGWLLVGLSIVEYVLAHQLPVLSSKSNNNRFFWQHYGGEKLFLKSIHAISTKSIIWLSIIGLSLFWGASQTLLATFPSFAKITLNENNTIIIQGLLTCAGIGIIIGSLVAGKLCNKYANKLVIIGTLGLTITLFLLPQQQSILGFANVILGFGLFGGLIIVPLNTFVQYHAPIEQLGIILAGNNWLQNIVMMTFLIITLFLAFFNVSSHLILLLLPVILVLIVSIILSTISKRI